MQKDIKQDYGNCVGTFHDENCGGNPHKEGNPHDYSKAMIKIGICQLIVTSASFFAQLLAIVK